MTCLFSYIWFYIIRSVLCFDDDYADVCPTVFLCRTKIFLNRNSSDERFSVWKKLSEKFMEIIYGFVLKTMYIEQLLSLKHIHYTF